MPKNEATRRPISPRSLKRWLWFGIAIAVAFSALMLADKSLLNNRIYNAIGLEPFKLVLQFLLITVAGGLVVALIGARKDEDVRADEDRKEQEARYEARVKAIQSLDSELSEAYRLIKQSRRRLRSRCDPTTMQSKENDFESCMDELLASQDALEEVEDNIEIRKSLIGVERYARVAPALHYAVRYLHDVFEDFEKGTVGRVAGGYEINALCINLRDFLDGSRSTPHFAGQVSDLYEEYKKKEQSLDQRHATLGKIVSLYEERKRRKPKEDYRYQKIAFQCIRTVALELRMASSEQAS